MRSCKALAARACTRQGSHSQCVNDRAIEDANPNHRQAGVSLDTPVCTMAATQGGIRLTEG